MDEVTLVVTSCKRHDLLKKTLESFVKFNTYPLKQVIVIEDSELDAPTWFEPLFGNSAKWITNGKNKGQIYSIDRAYAEVGTDYIFHCEDDWLFSRSGFIEESLEILKNHDNILQVWMRDDSAHPFVKGDLFPFPILKPEWQNGWSGFSFNPGLRRLKDYKAIGSYGQHVGYDPRTVDEIKLSRLYYDLGFYAAKILKAVEHIGGTAHVDFTKAAAPPKVLIAIPACHKYEYKNHSDGRIHKDSNENVRVQAVRQTWKNYLPAFKSYVDFKFFYGTDPSGNFRTPEEDEIFLTVGDDYNSLPFKVQAIFKYALDHGYDYVFKGDDDTFIYIDRLMASGFEQHDYTGYVPNDPRIPENQRYCSGGSGYWISRKAMEILVNSKIESGVWAEDQWVGNTLYKHNIKGVRDARYLPGFWEHFVNIEALPEDHSYISMHACTPKMMDQLFNKTVSPNFKKVNRAFHEDSVAGFSDYSIECDELLELVLIRDMPDLQKDIKNKVNKSIETLVQKLMKEKQRIDLIESRLEQFNLKSSHKI